MQLFGITQRTLEAALHGTEVRQEVIARNLANVNTPGFKRSDVSFQQALAEHCSRAAARSSSSRPSRRRRLTSMRADGNNVDVDAESANLAKNQLLFDSVMAIVTKRLHTMDTAITGAH